jgi:hypothetical protein
VRRSAEPARGGRGKARSGPTGPRPPHKSFVGPSAQHRTSLPTSRPRTGQVFSRRPLEREEEAAWFAPWDDRLRRKPSRWRICARSPWRAARRGTLAAGPSSGEVPDVLSLSRAFPKTSLRATSLVPCLHGRSPTSPSSGRSHAQPDLRHQWHPRHPWPRSVGDLEALQADLAERARAALPWIPPSDRPVRIGGVFAVFATSHEEPGRAWAGAVVMEPVECLRPPGFARGRRCRTCRATLLCSEGRCWRPP